MKKSTVLFLMFSLILLSGNMISRERQGARIIVHKKDGQILKGELVAVQQTHMLMLNSKTKYDERIDISDVKAMNVIGKPRIGLRILIGSMLGAGIGSALGFAEGDDPSYTEDSILWGPQMVDPETAEEKALGYGIWGAAIGAALGASIGE